MTFENRTDLNSHPESDVARTLDLDSTKGGGRRWRRWLVVVLIVLAPVAFLLLRNGSSNSSTQFKTQTAQVGDLSITVTATGNLEPTNEVEVGSELSGMVRSVLVDYNDMVKVDQVLAELDTSKLEAMNMQYKASLESAKAKVLQARATVKEARSNLARNREVHEKTGGKIPSQYELDAAEAALDRALADEESAKASVSQAQASLETNETDLEKLIIRSPVNGMVLTRSVEPGQTVAASFQAPILFTIAEDLTQMELHVDVDEADVGMVKEGQEATFTVDAYPNRTFQAHIIQVRYGSKVTEGVVTYETVLKVNNDDLSLRPGMTATADIAVKDLKDVVLIPNAVLRFTPPEERRGPSMGGGPMFGPPGGAPQRVQEVNGDETKQIVWTLRGKELVSISITIGASDGSMTELTGGAVSPGTVLVVDTVGKKE
jgi:HlyD family secretion protein